MKILFFLSQDIESPAGQGRYFPIAREMHALGHTVEIIALHPNYAPLRQRTFNKDGVTVTYVAQMHVRKIGNHKYHFNTAQLILTVLWSTFRLTIEALRRSSDIIFVGKPHPMNGVAALVAAKIKRKPIFLDTDDYEAVSNKFSGIWQKRVVAYFEDHLPLSMDGITTNTHFNRDRMIELGIAENRIALLPNHVDQSRFEESNGIELVSLRQELGIRDHQKVIGYIGSLSLNNHPIDLLIDAFDLIKTKVENAALVIVGSGEDFENLIRRASESNHSSDIHFTGQVSINEVGAYYRLADVTVDPVHDDLISQARNPLKIVESMYVGTPVVTGDIGDRGAYPSDLVTLVSPGSTSDLAKGIIRVLTMGDAHVQEITSRINTWDQIIPRFMSHFEEKVSKMNGV